MAFVQIEDTLKQMERAFWMTGTENGNVRHHETVTRHCKSDISAIVSP